MSLYRNQGGFDMLGRTQDSLSDDEIAQVLATAARLGLTGIVLIGGAKTVPIALRLAAAASKSARAAAKSDSRECARVFFFFFFFFFFFVFFFFFFYGGRAPGAPAVFLLYIYVDLRDRETDARDRACVVILRTTIPCLLHPVVFFFFFSPSHQLPGAARA
jgi:6-phosphofructokinase